jgi:RND family efflux transporter MFP subunit
MRKILRQATVAALFAALVFALLWFQGIVGRGEPRTTDVPAPPRVGASQRTARVERVRVPEVLAFSGYVEAIDAAAVAPRVMATIVSLSLREGDAVGEGEVVAVLDDRDARARLAQTEAALAAANAQSVQAGLAFERAKKLRAADAATEQDLEAARAARDGAVAHEERARNAADEARAALSWYTLVAPFGGRVLARHAEPGQMAVPGQPVVTLYRADAVRFAVAVPEERASRLVVGSEHEIAFEGGSPARLARLARVLPAADPRTGTVTLHFDLAGEGLRAGELGRLRLAAGEREALLVPAAAIERVGQIERARLVRDGAAALVSVRTGKRHGDSLEVLSGLAEGEVVVLP